MQSNGSESDEASILRFLACLPKVSELLACHVECAMALLLKCLTALYLHCG